MLAIARPRSLAEILTRCISDMEGRGNLAMLLSSKLPAVAGHWAAGRNSRREVGDLVESKK